VLPAPLPDAHRHRVAEDREDGPDTLEWFKEKDTVLFCDFLSRRPTQAKHARKTTLEAFFR
jgi:hypothetical protein